MLIISDNEKITSDNRNQQLEDRKKLHIKTTRKTDRFYEYSSCTIHPQVKIKIITFLSYSASGLKLSTMYDKA